MNPKEEKVEHTDNSDVLEKFRIAFQLLWQSRWLIVKITGIIAVGSVVVSLLLPKTYKATAILLPQTNQNILSSIGGLSNLASLAGISVGQTSMEQLFPDIIMSEAILKDVIYEKYATNKFPKPVDLIEYWEIDGDSALESYELTLEKFRKELEVDYDRKTNMVTLTLAMREPQLVADVLNKITTVLDEYIRTKRITNATEQRAWIEQRLEQVKSDLSNSENSLKNFREKNRVVETSPQLLLEQQRLFREVEINTVIFTELKKQFELAKIEELKNIPIINILDSARAPGIKYRPRRAVIVIISTFLGFIGCCGYIYYIKGREIEIQSYIKSLFIQ